MMAHEPVHVAGHLGLGDQIYMRPFIRRIQEKRQVFVETSFPQLWWDMPNIKCVKADGGLRTQAKNIRRVDFCDWHGEPRGINTMRISYAHDHTNKRCGIIASLSQQFQQPCDNFEWRVKPEWMTEAADFVKSLEGRNGRKIGIVRPPTYREEWPCPSRNPDPRVIPHIAQSTKDEIMWVAIGDIDPRFERIDGDEGYWEAAALKGELHVGALAALLLLADIVLASPCFVLPMSCAVGARAFFVFGGYVHPRFVIDPRMGLEKIEWIEPSPFCNCVTNQHDCEKSYRPEKALAKFNEFRRRFRD